MKKIFLGLFLIALVFSLKAQMITVSVPVVTANPGDIVNVPVVMVSGASSSGTPIGACDVNIDYNNVALTFIDLVNFYPGMPAGEWVYSGNISIVAANWIDANLLTEAVPDGTVLFEMQFTYNSGNSPLIFSKNEFYDVNYEMIPTTPINGAVNPSIIYQDVTFSVDMSRETISPNGVHLAGSFNNWNYTANQMVNNGSGVYSTTVQLEQNSLFTYRFVNGNTAAGLESVPAACGVLNSTGQYERQLSVGSQPVNLNTVCFSRCDVCPPLHAVTFKVDMINENVSVNGIHLAGSFNNWNYNSTPMVLTGAGAVYEVTLQLEEGAYYEFKFVNGNTAQSAEVVPLGCSNNGNRYLTIPANNITLNSFCFGECAECGSVLEFFELTFRVDMKNEVVSPGGIHIAGSFQGWQPGTTAMVEETGNVFTYTLTILEGSSVEYRFVNGNTAAGYENVPAPCSTNGNRFFNSISSNTTLPLVCFSACDTCQTPEVMVTFRVDMSGEGVTISPNGVHLAGSFQGWNPGSTPMNMGNFNIFTVTQSMPVGSFQQFRYVNGNTAAGYETVPFECADGENRFFTVPAADTSLTLVCFGSCDPCPVGVKLEYEHEPGMIIYPNPSSGDAMLRFSSNDMVSLTVKVYSVQGNIVLRRDLLQFLPGSNDLLLETGVLQPGIYMVVLTNTLTGKTIKQKFIKSY